MKQILKHNNTYILRFDRGEEVLEGIVAFAKKSKIKAGVFSGIGAAARVIISFYDLKQKKYLNKKFEEVEIASLAGNIGMFNGKRIAHAHGVFSGRDMAAKAGHVKEIVVSGTCEIRCEALSGTIERAPDIATGLNVIA